MLDLSGICSVQPECGGCTLGTPSFVRASSAAAHGCHGQGLVFDQLGCGWAKSVARILSGTKGKYRCSHGFASHPCKAGTLSPVANLARGGGNCSQPAIWQRLIF